jgi:NitT/TauT family transport system ATP-binding protein
LHGIELKKVNFSYGSQLVLKDIELTINQGDFVCLLGPSGCGKSTLLRLIAGLSNPTSGDILVNGLTIKEPGLDRGIVFQDYSLFPWISTGENIVLALQQIHSNKNKKELKPIADKFLKLVGLQDVYDKLPGQLSGGMRQRAAIARAFAINPPILLMDEPFGALDAVTRARLQDLVVELWSEEHESKKTVIFVTHDVDEALLLANKVVILGQGDSGIREICEINFPRPRLRNQLYNNQKFIFLRNHLLNILNEDVLNKLAYCAK